MNVPPMRIPTDQLRKILKSLKSKGSSSSGLIAQGQQKLEYAERVQRAKRSIGAASRRVVELALLEGVNDSPAHAEQRRDQTLDGRTARSKSRTRRRTRSSWPRCCTLLGGAWCWRI